MTEPHLFLAYKVNSAKIFFFFLFAILKDIERNVLSIQSKCFPPVDFYVVTRMVEMFTREFKCLRSARYLEMEAFVTKGYCVLLQTEENEKEKNTLSCLLG